MSPRTILTLLNIPLERFEPLTFSPNPNKVMLTDGHTRHTNVTQYTITFSVVFHFGKTQRSIMPYVCHSLTPDLPKSTDPFHEND